MENMEMLKIFSCFINEELEDAEKYAKQAVKWKDIRSDIAEAFSNLSKQEISHYQALGDMELKLIKYAADDGSGFGKEEMAVYEFLKECETEHHCKVKKWQDMYKEM